MILGQVEEAIARAREKIPGLKARTYLAEGKEVCWTGEAIAAKRYFPAWLIDEDNEYVQKALAGLKKAGIEAPISHFSFCTNGSHFCGEAGIPCIGYGPSLESLAHVRDEYIEIEQLDEGVQRLCQHPSGVDAVERGREITNNHESRRNGYSVGANLILIDKENGPYGTDLEINLQLSVGCSSPDPPGRRWAAVWM